MILKIWVQNVHSSVKVEVFLLRNPRVKDPYNSFSSVHPTVDTTGNDRMRECLTINLKK
jgi:hypothetical protein